MKKSRVVLMPGASLMEMTPVTGGLQVRCPACGQVQVFADDGEGLTSFVHGDGCSVHRQIVDALRQYERLTVRHG